MMFARVLSLILSTSGKPINNRDSQQVQEDTLHILGTLKRFHAPCDHPEVTEPAIRLVSGEAWSLLYLWLCLKHGWPGGQIEPQALASIETALKQHLEPILEEREHEQVRRSVEGGR